MKLRIRGNSIRLRLLRSEVDRLAANGVVSEDIRFGTATDQALKYSVASSDGVDEVTAQFSDNHIIVMLPESMALKWMTTDDVGIQAAQPISEGCDLSILIEKDFACSGRPEDPDNGDTFQDPSVGGC